MNTFVNKLDLLNRQKIMDLSPVQANNKVLQKEMNRGYDLFDVIGHGTYAKVRVAKNRRTGEKVAIKIIKVCETPIDYATKFLPREIEIIKQLNHPNITTVREVIENDSKIYIVMDLVRDGDLLNFINKRGPQTEDVTRHIFVQMMEALKYLHYNGIAHRDLKCENILLDPGLKLKLTDFGFAVKMSRDTLLSTSCGSFAYACPEILKGAAYDGRCADIWSSGIILYALLCGNLPFDGNNAKTLVKQIRAQIRIPDRLSGEARGLVSGILTEDSGMRLKIKQIFSHPFINLRTCNNGS